MRKIKADQAGLGHVEIVVVVIVLVLIGAVGWRVVSANNDDDQQASQSSQSEDMLPEDLSTVKSMNEIVALAREQTQESEIIGIELENNDGVIVYVVHLQNGTKLIFDATSGEVVNSDDDEDDEIEHTEALPGDFSFGITIQEAVDIALKERPNSVVEKVELELEDGVVVFSVRFTDDSRVDVDAANGEVQRVKTEEEKAKEADDDFDNDGIDNTEDDDDDNDGIKDKDDKDDDNDGVEDHNDDDDDNDGISDKEDDDHEHIDDEDDEDDDDDEDEDDEE